MHFYAILKLVLYFFASSLKNIKNFNFYANFNLFSFSSNFPKLPNFQLRVYGTLILMSFMLFQDKYLRLLSLRRVGQRQPTNADQHFAEFQRVIA